jgi:type II secretion system protein H
MKTRLRHSGFTLLELILVMGVICVTLALSAPSLSNWNRGSQKRDAVDQIVALTRYARTQAVTNAQVYRLNVEKQSGRYWLTMQDGQEFVQLGNDMGQMFSIPDGSRLELSQEEGPAMDFVEFYPSGRTQVSRLRLTNNVGEVTQIECAMPTEGFQVVAGQVQAR